MPPKSEEVIVRSKTLDKSIELAQRIGKYRERISLGVPRPLGDNEFGIEITRGTIDDFREMIKGISSLEIVDEIEINLDSIAPPAHAKPTEKQ